MSPTTSQTDTKPATSQVRTTPQFIKKAILGRSSKYAHVGPGNVWASRTKGYLS